MECLYEFQRGRPNPNKARVREENGFWKGGVTTVNENARDILEEWKKRKLKEQNYTCYVTGKRGGNLVVHHVVPFHKLRDKVLADLDIEGGILISEYYPEQIKTFRTKIKELHETEEGIVLREDIHTRFHSEYGFDTDISNLEEFKENYLLK